MKQIVWNLTKKLYIGKGSHKKCFFHPISNALCIKLPYNEAGKIDLDREIAYLQRVYSQHKKVQSLPFYYGPTRTSLGTGYVFEYVSNFDGTPSVSLQWYLQHPAAFKKDRPLIIKAITKLKENILKEEIISMNLYAENILLKREKNGTLRAFLINDLGSSSILPLEYYFSSLRKRKIERIWERFRNKMRGSSH